VRLTHGNKRLLTYSLMCVVLLFQAKYIAQIVVAGAQIVGRAFVKALQSELRSSQQAAQARSSAGRTNFRSAATDALSGMTLQVSSYFCCSLRFSTSARHTYVSLPPSSIIWY